jgi:hypothetical protein
MKIGLFTGPTFRPHVDHVAWLGQLARNAGHSVIGLSCDGAVRDCYGRAWLGRGRIGCFACSVAGLRSDPTLIVQSARGVQTTGPSPEGWHSDEILSSVRTLLREEDDERLTSPAANSLRARLAPSAERMFTIVHEWIGRERLDAMLVFNGRMDITRAAIRAAHQRGIAFATVERASFDTGIRIMAMTDCNSLRNEDPLQLAFRDAPLLSEQALLAAEFIARRVSRQPVSEWRSYNPNRVPVGWPTAAAATRVLVGLSSQYEVRGEKGWTELRDVRDAVDDVVARLPGPVSVVVRAHPVWGERIAGISGASAAAYYREWCARRGYVFIEPESNADTRSLTRQADLVLATGGTIGIEAACEGHATLTLAPCYYRRSGAVGDAVGPSAVADALGILDVSPRERMRLALRSLYAHAFRTTQYCRYARPVPASQGASWEFRDGADFTQVETALRTGWTQPDDERTAPGPDAEDGVITMMEREEWKEIIDRAQEVRLRITSGTWRQPKVSLAARALLTIRGRLPSGDRMRG